LSTISEIFFSGFFDPLALLSPFRYQHLTTIAAIFLFCATPSFFFAILPFWHFSPLLLATDSLYA
jgi:hypothetical protein